MWGTSDLIEDAPKPKNVTELKSYLGLLSYYGKFLPNRAQSLAPLYKLLGHDTSGNGNLLKIKLLRILRKCFHFDSSLPLTLACDVSAYGIDVVLAHRMPDGSEKPIGYAWRTLNKAEKNYSQLEKEGLSCIFGIKRFYSYLFGHPFELITDHKPLLGLLGEHKSTSPQESARIRRWSLYMSMFEYTLKYRKTMEHANVDALSRLPTPVEPATTDTPPELVLLINHLADSPVTTSQIASWTSKDPELSPVIQFLRQGWPTAGHSQKRSKLTPFLKRKNELSLYEGCVLWGNRVVVPKRGREAVLV